MKLRYLKPERMHCFSPPVMIASFLIEVILAATVWWKYKLNEVTRLTIAILLLLATFQLAEFNVCEGSFGIDNLSWARIGFIAITFLPPLGFHLATKIAGKQNQKLALSFAYLGAVAFAFFFGFVGHGIASQVCLGNYVIFGTAPGSAIFYTFYYYGWIIAGAVYCWVNAKVAKKKNIAASLRWLMIGYAIFILPTTLVNIVDPATIAGIPSIMCGFAVLLAIALAGRVLPNYFDK